MIVLIYASKQVGKAVKEERRDGHISDEDPTGHRRLKRSKPGPHHSNGYSLEYQLGVARSIRVPHSRTEAFPEPRYLAPARGARA